MSSVEYYSDFQENKSAPEFKEFKAELYERKNEYFSVANEIKGFNFESFDDPGQANNGNIKAEKKKKASGEEKKSTEKKVQRDLLREYRILLTENDIDIAFPQVVINQPSTKEYTLTNKEKLAAQKFAKEQKGLSVNLEEQQL